LKNILSGPHTYVNGHYISTAPTPEEIAKAVVVEKKEEPAAEPVPVKKDKK
jgi:hypothetical protein